jgi:osmoprotectant transport system substrate-binding protein
VNIRRTLPLFLAPLLVVAAVACGDDDDSAGSSTNVTVGSSNFPESDLLAQIYGQALAANGFQVKYQPGIGAREVYYKAIVNGEIDLVPEFTNSILSYVIKQKDPSKSPTSKEIDAQVTELGKELPDTLEVLTPSTAEDRDVIACNPDAAKKYSLTNLTSLGKASKDITIAAPPEFKTRSPFGLVGFKENYGAEFKEFKPLAVAAVADALKAKQVDCGNLFSTMSVITTGGFTILDDDKNTVAHEAVLPLVRKAVVSDKMKSTLDNIDKQLNTDVLKQLMVKIEVDGAAPDVVAKDWLASLK